MGELVAACNRTKQLCRWFQLGIQCHANGSDPESSDHQKQKLASAYCHKYACSRTSVKTENIFMYMTNPERGGGGDSHIKKMGGAHRTP